MTIFGRNLKYLRGIKGLTQVQLAEKTGLTRSVISSYEEGRADPRLKTLQFISFFFKVSVDDLLARDFENTAHERFAYTSDQGIKVLTVAVNRDTNEELIPLVGVKATAGYTAGYGDVDYMQTLPKVALPFPEISPNKTYRIFQAEGDSMLPVPDEAYLIAEFVQDWRDIKNESCCVVVTLNDGVVFKRIINNLGFDGSLLLKSDNPEFKPYTLSPDRILEMWRVVGYTTFSLPDPNDKLPGMVNIESALSRLAKEVKKLKKKK